MWLLELPWGGLGGGMPAGVTYYKSLTAHAYVGTSLPAALEPYASKPYSYLRWREDELNGSTGLGATAAPMTLRPEQRADVDAIATAAEHGFRQVHLANDVGTGKTLVAVAAAKAIATMRGARTILVTVDRPARITIPSWRRTIAALGDDDLRWIIMSSDSLGKLMAQNGRPRLKVDVAVIDEAHQFRHDSKRTSYMRRLTRMDAPHDTAPFVLTITATPGHHPGEWGYMSSLYAQVHGDPPAQWADFGRALADRGVPLEPSYGKWTWSAEAKESLQTQQAAISDVRDILLRHDPPLMLTRSAVWGPPPFDVDLVELTPDQWRAYELEWGDFQREMQLARTGNNVARGLAALVRLRQKASMIRVEDTVAAAKAELARGYQVLIATEMVSTAAHPVAEMLEADGIPVARIYGSNPEAEAERMRFQRGEAPVVVFNTPTAINLQAGEQFADGSFATDTPRRGFFHQARYSGLLAEQTMGRAHRNHQVCSWSLLAAAGTIEERAGMVMLSRLIASATSTDADASTFSEVARVFGIDWIPAARLADELS
ncbi:DEAD/DEAH box helicase family protein [Dietzia cinnamea]|uniref:DEAD/DEAH box helicase family protein n=1 Tax=Dietzia cinnamea TaxID=321318 RepID=UPI0021A6A9B7|nr:DEAD/DEAH box helicase family protein [Dietzia cinnamea]MCT2122406.1 DEAD/DEAH box helicase [Dietzia cinnamea]MCT2146519.1 DEAD/DEAH box helicase [Dietzia cinnamea]MCT2303506.1 DEAD/DEAH box helicase [Dietzia cinnamea]